MSQRNIPRVDRFAQMSRQEELIARKRQEILEKQRTAELARAVAAAQSLAAKMKNNHSQQQPQHQATEGFSSPTTSTTTTPCLFNTEQDSNENLGHSMTHQPPPPPTLITSQSKTVKAFIATSPLESGCAGNHEYSVQETIGNQNHGVAATLQTSVSKSSQAALMGKTGKITSIGKRMNVILPMNEQPPSKIQNNFCNDGSFLENFKKILEKQKQEMEQQQQQQMQVMDMIKATNTTQTATTPGSEIVGDKNDMDSVQNKDNSENLSDEKDVEKSNEKQQQHLIQNIDSISIVSGGVSGFVFNPTSTTPSSVVLPSSNMIMSPTNMSGLISTSVPPPTILPSFFTGVTGIVPPPPPPSSGAAAAAAMVAMLMPVHAITNTPPPPPPPPVPMVHGNLVMGAPYMLANSVAPPALNNSNNHNNLNTTSSSSSGQLYSGQQHIQNEVNSSIKRQQQPYEVVFSDGSNDNSNNCNNNSNSNSSSSNYSDISTIMRNNNFENNINLSVNTTNISAGNFDSKNNINNTNSNCNINEIIISNNIGSGNNNNNSDCNVNVNNDNIDDLEMILKIPATYENLIELVADNGDNYEEKLRQYKNKMHPVLWFICDKDTEKYHHYRQQVIDRRHEKLKEQAELNKIEKDLKNKDNNKYNSNKDFPSRESDRQTDSEDKYDPESVISADNDSDDEYRRGILDRNRDNIKRRIECRNELSDEERLEQQEKLQQRMQEMSNEDNERNDTRDIDDDGENESKRKRLRKSRWGGKVDATLSNQPSTSGNTKKLMLSTITRNDPALLQYAKLNYGSIDLSEEDWKKCEEHYKVNLLYQDMMRKRNEIDRLARNGKFKYEYDSDEDVEGGTWEHKLRMAEMEATQAWAQALTKQSKGKHHIGDFLPPEELKKFMEQYDAKKGNRQPDLSDYKEYKLKADNKGFQMLQKLGWKEGQGLGQDGEGIVQPINKGPRREGNQGLGVQNSATPEECDNEYDAYRKRMMLAYRFRPNPLNNPRRAYY